jgi:glycosyltransferase involved in cell wall biosynthesis
MTRLSWIHNGVTDRYEEVTLEKAGVVVLTLGSLAWYKNPDLWLEIASRILEQDGSVEFWWGGTGPMFGNLSKEAASEKRIKFLGFVSDPKDVFSRASVYFQPSRFESFGLGVCEAMMFGLPSVVTDCGGVTELIQNNQTGYIVRESDEADIVEKLLRLIRSEDLREEMGRKARIRYLENFSASHWKGNMNALLSEKD